MKREIRRKLKNAVPKESEENQLKTSVWKDQGSNKVRELHHRTAENHEKQKRH